MSRFICFFFLILFFIHLNAENYYINSTLGSDANKGDSELSCWKTLRNVNSHTFQPGDSIFFISDGVWFENFNPKGSGISGDPIVVSSYGKGNKPLFVGTNAVGLGVVSLYNQSYWEISNLELVNNGEEYADRRGVEVLAENAGVIRHIYLKDLSIHHVKGIPGNDEIAKKTAGIYFGVSDDKLIPTRFDDILIENCIVHDVVNQGIALSHDLFKGRQMYPGEDASWNNRKFTNFVIRNNVIYNVSKNAMIIRMTEGGIIEHNVCFNTALGGTGNTIFTVNALNTVFQYNEGFLNKSHDHDGSMYDPDLSSPKTIWRYSYSHDNAHGLLWMCTRANDSGILVHDNISENDRGFLNYFNYAYNDVEVFQNIYLSAEHLSPFLIRENPKNKHNSTKFQNNVVINRSSTMGFEYQPELVSEEARKRRIIQSNLYFGKLLEGSYINIQRPVSDVPYFHRGLHKTPDDINHIFHQTIPEVVPVENKFEGKIVATVNGIPVYRREVDEKMHSLKVYFISCSQAIHSDLLREAALKKLFLEKLQIDLMQQKGIKMGQVLSNLETYFHAENNFRKQNLYSGNVILYGPVAYTLEGYRAYIWANAVQDLKDEMLGDEIKFADKELRDFFQSGDLNRFDPKWALRGYEYSLTAIKTLLIDKIYDDFFLQKLKEAIIVYVE